MAAGQAEVIFRNDPSMLVGIYDKRNVLRSDPMWLGNPVIATAKHVNAGNPVHVLVNGEGRRPYIRYPFTAERGMGFTDWRANDHIGKLYLTDDELAVGRRIRSQIGPFLVIEPDVKPKATPNKKWGVDRFARVVEALPDVAFIRAHGDECQPFSAARNVRTRSFREACGVLAASDGYVGTEGGFHHAAAALGKSAVVIFGGFISPKTTGYDFHLNIADNGQGSPCGTWKACAHCQAAMARITVEEVTAAVRQMVGAREVAACL